jgi:hypothetical protein
VAEVDREKFGGDARGGEEKENPRPLSLSIGLARVKGVEEPGKEGGWREGRLMYWEMEAFAECVEREALAE